MFVALSFGLISFVLFYTVYYGLDMELFGIIDIIMVCIDISFNFVILYMLLKRLYRMIAHLDESYQNLIVRMNTIDATSEQNNNFAASQQQSQLQSHSEYMMEENRIADRIEKNSMHQTEIVNMMAKVSLLTIISVIFINVYFIAVIYFLFG